jgi:tripartite-type tricarboxylate transporter receptor subunit TctC
MRSMTRREFGDYIENDAKKWAELVRKAGLVL